MGFEKKNKRNQKGQQGRREAYIHALLIHDFTVCDANIGRMGKLIHVDIARVGRCVGALANERQNSS